MTHWLTMVLANGTYDGKQIVDPKALLPALTPQIVSEPARPSPRCGRGFYGYGFNVGTTSAARTQLSHSGAFELGAGTNFVILPSADVAIVALTNATPSGVPETLTAEFADLVQFGEVREDWCKLYNEAVRSRWRSRSVRWSARQPPANPAPAAPLATYVGDLRQRLLGPGDASAETGRQAAARRSGPKLQCAADPLGRKRVHLRVGQRELAAGHRSPRRRSTATS